MQADAERRKNLEELRERRKKKILENASLRMEKLKGHNKETGGFVQNDPTASDENTASGDPNSLISTVLKEKSSVVPERSLNTVDHVVDPVRLTGVTADEKNASNVHAAKSSENDEKPATIKARSLITVCVIASFTALNKTRIVALVILALVISLYSSCLSVAKSYIILFGLFEFSLLIFTCVYTIRMSERLSVEPPTSLGMVLQTVSYFKPSLTVSAEAILLTLWAMGCVLKDLCVFLFSIFVLAAVQTMF